LLAQESEFKIPRKFKKIFPSMDFEGGHLPKAQSEFDFPTNEERRGNIEAPIA